MKKRPATKGITKRKHSPIPSPRIGVFDPEEAIGRCFNSRYVAREMILCFLDDVDTLLPQMHMALEKGDLEEVGRLGHRMKGTILYLGARPATESAVRVERFSTSSVGTPSEAEEAVSALERECLLLKAVLIGHPLVTEPAPEDEAAQGECC